MYVHIYIFLCEHTNYVARTRFTRKMSARFYTQDVLPCPCEWCVSVYAAYDNIPLPPDPPSPPPPPPSPLLCDHPSDDRTQTRRVHTHHRVRNEIAPVAQARSFVKGERETCTRARTSWAKSGRVSHGGGAVLKGLREVRQRLVGGGTATPSTERHVSHPVKLYISKVTKLQHVKV